MQKYDVYKEIHEQPDTWELIIEDFEDNKDEIENFLKIHDSFIFVGCGSGGNASVYSKNVSEYYLEKNCFEYQSSEIKFFWNYIYRKEFLKKPITFLFSRSGETTETVDALREINKSRISDTFAITCDESSYLYRNSSYSFSLSKAKEKSVVTTKSFTAMTLLPLLFFSNLSKRVNDIEEIKRLPDLGRRIINEYERLGKRLGDNIFFEKYFILSSTPSFGLARESKLKILEMTVSWADCFNPLDFRHGPRAVVDKNSLILLFLSDEAIDYEFKLVKDLKKQGANFLLFGDVVPEEFYELTDNIVEIGEKINEWNRGILFLPVIHFLSYFRAVKKGLDPGNPENLTYFVKIK